MKTKVSHTRLSANGGIMPILKTIKNKGIPDLIRQCLGNRPKQSSYSYDEVITAWMTTIYCHGFRLIRSEDTKSDLSIIKNFKIPSHDTIGRIMKKLATPTFTFTTINKSNPKRGEKNNMSNENVELNDMLIKGCIQMGLLKTDETYTLDIDATALTSKVKEASITYKHHYGFMPMVCMIGKLPVFISMRGGNSNPHYEKLTCLKDAIELLRKNNITISRVRIDGAGYKVDLLKYLDSQNIKFVISAPLNNNTKKVAAYNKWTNHDFNLSNGSIPVQTTSRRFRMKSNDIYRIVAIRINKNESEDHPANWKQIKKHCYRFIITNDYETSEIELFNEYKQRGAIEQNFSSLKNDFGWKILPFSKMNENLVYLILTAFTSNVYQGLLKLFSKTIKEVKETLQLKTFRSLFIQVIFTIKHNTIIFFGNAKIDFQKIK